MTSHAIARRCVMLSAIALALAGCGGEWAPSNPYDPATEFRLRIVGPAVASAIDDTVTFRVETTPSWQSDWPALQVTWSGQDGLTSLGDGRFIVNDGDPTTLAVRAAIGKREAVDSLRVQRHATRLTAYWCDRPDSLKTLSVDSYGPVTLCAHYYDRHGFEINPAWLGTVAFAQPVDGSLVAMSSGASSAGATPVTITPLADGATDFRLAFQVAGGPILVDSVRLVVRQRIAGIIVAPCGTTISVGDTVRLTAQAVDAAGIPFAKPPTRETWTVQNDRTATGTVASITPDGLLTAGAAGDYAAIVSIAWTDEGVNQIIACRGTVR